MTSINTTQTLPSNLLTKEKHPPAIKPILECQGQAPSPSQTYYQLLLFPYHGDATQNRLVASTHREKIQQGAVVLRDWPQRRITGGETKPREKIIDYKDFVDGDSDTLIVNVFGQERYDQFLVAVKTELAKKGE